MSAAVAPDLLGFHCGPMFAAGLPIQAAHVNEARLRSVGDVVD